MSEGRESGQLIATCNLSYHICVSLPLPTYLKPVAVTYSLMFRTFSKVLHLRRGYSEAAPPLCCAFPFSARVLVRASCCLRLLNVAFPCG